MGKSPHFFVVTFNVIFVCVVTLQETDDLGEAYCLCVCQCVCERGCAFRKAKEASDCEAEGIKAAARQVFAADVIAVANIANFFDWWW
jgi:hypothetical protein